MNQNLENNNYVIVDNFVSVTEAQNLYNILISEINTLSSDVIKPDHNCPLSPKLYQCRFFLKLLCEKLLFINEFMGETMLPTYSYARLYKHGETLKKHLDRDSCEISVTLHLGGDNPWKIYITKPNGETVGIELKPGQAIVYRGTISEHWRDAYLGNNYGQVFLHYVRADGPHWIYYGDPK